MEQKQDMTNPWTPQARLFKRLMDELQDTVQPWENETRLTGWHERLQFVGRSRGCYTWMWGNDCRHYTIDLQLFGRPKHPLTREMRELIKQFPKDHIDCYDYVDDLVYGWKRNCPKCTDDAIVDWCSTRVTTRSLSQKCTREMIEDELEHANPIKRARKIR